MAAFADQLGHQLRHAPVALREGFGVVVIAFPWVLKHELEMADQLTLCTSRNRWLMHMQGASEAGLEFLKIRPLFALRCWRPLLHHGFEFGFIAGDRRRLQRWMVRQGGSAIPPTITTPSSDGNRWVGSAALTAIRLAGASVAIPGLFAQDRPALRANQLPLRL
jgi:hypothetical protein